MSCDVQVFTWARVQQLLVLEQCYHQFYQCVTMCNVSVFTWVRIQHLPSSTTQSCQCVAKCDVLVFTWVKGTASAKQHYPVQPMCCYVWCFSVYLDKDTAAAKQHYRVLLCIGVLSSLTHGWRDIKKWCFSVYLDKDTAAAKQHYQVLLCIGVLSSLTHGWRDIKKRCFSVYLDKDTAAAKQHYRVLLCIGVLSSLTHGWWDIKKRFPFLSGHDAVGNIRTVKFASNGLYCYCVYFCVSVCGRACLCVIFRPVFCLYFL